MKYSLDSRALQFTRTTAAVEDADEQTEAYGLTAAQTQCGHCLRDGCVAGGTDLLPAIALAKGLTIAGGGEQLQRQYTTAYTLPCGR